METSIVTIKGQVVIPAKIRRKFGIKNGTKVQFFEENGEIKMVPITEKTIESNVGLLETKGNLLKALMEDKKKEREL
jgi:AbrB family looped-hinge helix DNA binding protein